jgi:membrane protease YdiL (CAAX protease family)
MAEELGGIGRTGLIATGIILFAVLIAPALAAILVFVWLFLTRKPFSEVGLSMPDSWARVIVWGIVVGVALKLLMKAVVLPYLGAPMLNPGYQYLRDDLPAVLEESVMVILLAGFAEEVVFRGFLLNRLQAYFGTGFFKKLLMVLGTALVFGLLHLQQGPAGIVQAALLGGLFSTIYFLNCQRLWFLIFAHAAFDVAAVWIIYLGLEERLAQSIFG